MAIEMEAKFRLDDHVNLRRRLLDLKAMPRLDVLEHNELFDTPDDRLSDGGLGLRLRENCDPRTRDLLHAVLTVKGPIQRGPFKRRAEHETNVSHPAAMRDALLLLGYRVVLVYEKRRQSFVFGSCIVDLDELPSLGCFAEIEGPDAGAIRAAMSALDIDPHSYVKRGYADLITRHHGSDVDGVCRELFDDGKPRDRRVATK